MVMPLHWVSLHLSDKIQNPVAHLYPLMLDVTDRRILIVGGGAVAARKAAALSAAGSTRIRVIATEFRADFSDKIERIIKPYDRGDLNGIDLAFAATDSSEVNDLVVRDARTAGILVNRADGSDESPGDFTTVSAQSAALAAMIRDELQAGFDPHWAAMAAAMQQLRPLIKSSIENPRERATLFRALATPQARQILHDNGYEGLKNWILSTAPHTL
jgi:precorrin-2 dehydrogenase/sirohydrochlorin ferrochelatase